MMTKASKDPRTGAYKTAFSPWAWEIVSCTSSLALLIAIIVILAQVDGRPQEEWQHPITLNSLVNTLSTLFRACLAATATEMISQQKWVWFWSTPKSSRRPISHLQSFDAGSRSLLGGLNLLPIVARQYPFAMLPVVVLVASLLVGPFAQQSIRILYKDVPSELGAASLPISRVIDALTSNSYYNTMPLGDYTFFSLINGPRVSVFNTVSNPSSNDLTITPECPTGNCDFPALDSSGVTHTSLGVCSICSDMTSLVTEEGDDGSYGLPTFSIEHKMRLAVETWANVTWAETTMTTEHKALSRWALVNATVLTVTKVGQLAGSVEYPNTPVAVSCSLYACLRSYTATIRDNKLSEKLKSSTPLAPDLANFTRTGSELDEKIWTDFIIATDSNPYNLSAIQSPCRIGNDIYSASNISQAPGAVPVRLVVPDGAPDYPPTLAPEECIARVDMFTQRLVGGAYGYFLSGDCSGAIDAEGRLFCKDNLWLEKLFNNGRATAKSLSDYYDDIAEASTKQIRLGLLRRNGTTDRAEGISLQRTAHIRIEWTWLILPMALLALDITVLVCMIVRSIRYRDREAVWKSNALPLLYYKSRFVGLEPEDLAHSAYDPLEMASAETDRFMTTAELQAIAQNVKVRLRRSGPGEAEPAHDGEDVEAQSTSARDGEDVEAHHVGVQSRQDAEARLLEANSLQGEHPARNSTAVAPE